MTARPATEAAPLVECQPFPVPSALFVPGAFPVPEPNPKSPLAPDEGRLTQFGAGAVVSFPAPSDVVVLPVVVVSTATTRMSPAGMPFAFTVTERPPELPTVTLV